MARLLTNGFETQFPLTATASMDGQGEGFFLTGAASIVTATPRSGAANLSFAPAAANHMTAQVTTVLGRTYYARAALRFDATPNGTLPVLQFGALATVLGGIRFISGTNTLKLFDTTGVIGAATASLSTGTWYVIELAINVPAAGNGTLDYRIDGVAAAQGPQAASVGNSAITLCRTGHLTAGDTAATIQVDDFALNDDQGTAQNSWPGLGKVIHLKPISDSAVGTGWLEADGTTGSLYDNVDNEPPTGVAATPTTGATQIKNASNGGPFNYDANVQTYTTGGLAAADLVLLTRAIMRLSGSSTTGTNDGFGRVVSNPADAGDTTWTAAFDVVAGADTSAGSGWKSWVTPYVYAPTVVKGTSPVIRVVKNTAATRVHMADLMVLEVEYLLPTTYTDTGSGTITISGTATDSRSAADTRTGTLTESGTATDSKAVTDTGSGTVTLSGAATEGKTYTDAQSGTISLSGSASESYFAGTVYTDSQGGTITASGTSTDARSASDSQAGTLTASGAVTEGLAHSATRSGTISLSGSKVEALERDDTGSGTLTLSGSATESQAFVFTDTGSGTISLSGSATEFAGFQYDDTGTGTLTLSGVGAEDITFVATRTGTIVLVGTKAEAYAVTDAMAGALAISGAVRQEFHFKYWPNREGGEWPEDEGSEWAEDEGDEWAAGVGTGWTPSSGNEWE